MSSAVLGVVLRPSRTHGSCWNQFPSVHLDIREALRDLWKRSTIPFASGLYDVVVRCLIPSCLFTASHNADVKLVPLSEVMTSGRPNVEIQETKALMHDSAVASLIGTASGHLDCLSIIVNRYLKLFEGGSGPTMSTWMCPKRLDGSLKDPIPDSVCRCVFAVWQSVQVLAHSFTSRAMPGQMNLLFMSFSVALRDGCDKLWMRSKAFLRSGSGTQGRGIPLLVSHRISMLSSILILVMLALEFFAVVGGFRD